MDCLMKEAGRMIGVDVREARVAVLRAAFRGNSDGARLSPIHDIAALLRARGYCDIAVHSPLVRRSEVLELLGIPLTSDLREALRGTTIIVVATRHSTYRGLKVSEMLSVAGGQPVVIDTVNALEDGIECLQLSGPRQALQAVR